METVSVAHIETSTIDRASIYLASVIVRLSFLSGPTPALPRVLRAEP